MKYENSIAIIPAAGKGSRLNSSVPKPFVHISDSGPTLIEYVVSSLSECVGQIVVVLSPAGLVFADALRTDWGVAIRCQESPTGMLSAIFEAEKLLDEFENVVIVWSDQVGISQETVNEALRLANSMPRGTCVIPVAHVVKPYVQYCFNDEGLIDVRESRKGHAVDEVGFTDVGTFVFKGGSELVFSYREYLNSLCDKEMELDMLPFILYLSKEPMWRVLFSDSLDAMDRLSVNTPEELKLAARLLGN
jgi:bifunctional UDP-N-acetylglucosamine pyrophosphorylase/glucosamine-1-phosphate N-acetyltransferase